MKPSKENESQRQKQQTSKSKNQNQKTKNTKSPYKEKQKYLWGEKKLSFYLLSPLLLTKKKQRWLYTTKL